MTHGPTHDDAPLTVVVGRIGRAHGVRGDVSVDVRTDEPDVRFAVGRRLLAVTAPEDSGRDGRPLEVVSTRPHQGRLLAHFSGVEDRTAAEGLLGLLLLATVDRAEKPEDPEEFYDHQLVGLRAVDTGGLDAGVVREVVHTAGQDLLVLDRDGVEVLVPFVSALVPEVDLAAGRLVVADRPGLLDADAVDAGAADDATSSGHSGPGSVGR